MKFEFKIDETKWNYVKDKGFPEDDEWGMVIYETDEEYDYHIGSYSEEEKIFYVDFGYGGSSVDADSVVAWVPLFEGDDGYLNIT